jgi:hypothetical protein
VHGGGECRVRPFYVIGRGTPVVSGGWRRALRERGAKEARELSSIPVLVMTAATDPQAKVKELEPEGLLKKPFKDIATILRNIERFL